MVHFKVGGLAGAMNSVYFFCTSCKVFVNAGYRWAYWTLEDAGVVKRGETVDPELILAADEYWNPERDESSKWLLDEVLPSVRLFIGEHRTHHIVFDQMEWIYETGPDWFLEWIQEGFLADTLPRFCLERLQCESWTVVCEHMNRLRFKPGWWNDVEERARAEKWYKAHLIRRFENPPSSG